MAGFGHHLEGSKVDNEIDYLFEELFQAHPRNRTEIYVRLHEKALRWIWRIIRSRLEVPADPDVDMEQIADDALGNVTLERLVGGRSSLRVEKSSDDEEGDIMFPIRFAEKLATAPPGTTDSKIWMLFTPGGRAEIQRLHESISSSMPGQRSALAQEPGWLKLMERDLGDQIAQELTLLIQGRNLYQDLGPTTALQALEKVRDRLRHEPAELASRATGTEAAKRFNRLILEGQYPDDVKRIDSWRAYITISTVNGCGKYLDKKNLREKSAAQRKLLKNLKSLLWIERVGSPFAVRETKIGRLISLAKWKGKREFHLSERYTELTTWPTEVFPGLVVDPYRVDELENTITKMLEFINGPMKMRDAVETLQILCQCVPGRILEPYKYTNDDEDESETDPLDKIAGDSPNPLNAVMHNDWDDWVARLLKGKNSLKQRIALSMVAKKTGYKGEFLENIPTIAEIAKVCGPKLGAVRMQANRMGPEIIHACVQWLREFYDLEKISEPESPQILVLTPGSKPDPVTLDVAVQSNPDGWVTEPSGFQPGRYRLAIIYVREPKRREHDRQTTCLSPEAVVNLAGGERVLVYSPKAAEGATGWEVYMGTKEPLRQQSPTIPFGRHGLLIEFLKSGAEAPKYNTTAR